MIPSNFNLKVRIVDTDKHGSKKGILQLMPHLNHGFYTKDIAFCRSTQQKRIIAKGKAFVCLPPGIIHLQINTLLDSLVIKLMIWNETIGFIDGGYINKRYQKHLASERLQSLPY
jgi:hypothetical protein